MTSTYSVRSGDTLNALAKRFGVSTSQLAKSNNISNPNQVAVGQKLVVPDSFEGKKAPASQQQAASSKPANDQFEAKQAGAMKDGTGRTYPTSRDGTPLYKQGDAQWGGRSLGTGSSIAAAGCAMSSTAMAISKIGGKAINPGELDAYLDKHGGYSGNGLNWGVAAKAAGLTASKQPWNMSTINKQIDAGRPVVVGVDYKAGSNGGSNGTDHWIAITGRGKENGKDVYYANDPASGKQITLTEQNGRLSGPSGTKNYKTTGELVTFGGGNPHPGTTSPSQGSGGTASTGGTPAPSQSGGTASTGGSSTSAPTGGSVKGMSLPAGDLEKGAKGEGVKHLQEALVKAGYMTQAQMSTGPGTFGPKTQAALKEFQAAHGVPSTGFYGPLTRQAFEHLGAKVSGGGSAPSTGGTKPSTGGGSTPSTGGAGGTSSTGGVTGNIPKTGNAFIDRVSADAIKSQRATGVPASVTMAQAILESGWGKSGLSTKANNFFGIKGEGPAGHVTMSTREVIHGKSVMVDANFRKYSSPAESFTDHGNFLRDNKRYAGAFQHTKDPEQFARDIQKAGYATDPNYANALIGIMKQYGLERFDKLA